VRAVNRTTGDGAEKRAAAALDVFSPAEEHFEPELAAWVLRVG
jgi:hypothetical protein